MSYVITEACVGTCDTSCVEVCPVDCIHGPISVDEIALIRATGDKARLANIQLYIDPEVCIGCSVCVPVCPVNAIFEDDDVPAASFASIARNLDFFK